MRVGATVDEALDALTTRVGIGYTGHPDAESRASPRRQTKSDTYTCPACNGTFDKVDTDDVEAEAQLMWGDADPDQLVTACDDCFKAGMAQLGINFG